MTREPAAADAEQRPQLSDAPSSRRRMVMLLVGTAAAMGAIGWIATTRDASDVNPADQTGPSTEEADETVYVEIDTLVPSQRGQDPQVFSGGVSAATSEEPALADGRARVVLTLGANSDEICLETSLPSGTSEGCVVLSDIQTGTVYQASQDEGGVVDIVGLVPDDAATVAIAGTTIQINNNVWHYVGRVGDDHSFRVHSADGTITATRG